VGSRTGRAAHDEAVALGVFGVPTVVVDTRGGRKPVAHPSNED
jgi:hypothetical protein